jgi:hypothetical protein
MGVQQEQLVDDAFTFFGGHALPCNSDEKVYRT